MLIFYTLNINYRLLIMVISYKKQKEIADYVFLY